MSKIKKFFKRPAQAWRHIFGFLPIISLGGTALILGTLSIAPNFMDFAHAEGGTNPPAPGETTLSVSIENDFYYFRRCRAGRSGADCY